MCENKPYTIKKLSPFFGAEIHDISLKDQLNNSTIDSLSYDFAKYELLVFPNQNLTTQDLKKVGSYFGKLTVHPFAENSPEDPEVIVFDYKEGNPPVLTDRWHSDETYRECPPMGTMLYSRSVPEVGGDTCFCSMTAAYEFLSKKMQEYIEGLEAVHDFTSFKYLFPDSESGKIKLKTMEEAYPPVTHPVVRKHPITGKNVLFVNPHYTRYIKNMDDRDSVLLLQMLFTTTSVLEYQYRHRWKPNTLLFWDNRSVQHAAVHDYYPKRRHMERITIEGDRPIGACDPESLENLRKFKVPQYDHSDSRRALRQFEME